MHIRIAFYYSGTDGNTCCQLVTFYGGALTH
jgi:hypothetical protein